MPMILTRHTLGMLVSCAFALCSLVQPVQTGAAETGQPAPDFTLPSTTGLDISLSEFKGKKWVFLEFYGSDFAPT